jgi:acetyl esterase/lipase
MVGILALVAMMQGQEPIRLWNVDAPLAKGSEAKDVPTITYFPASQDKRHAALVIYPGGGYGMLADHEGAGYAEYFAGQGYDCFVVKYRLGSDGYRNPVMRLDGERAVRLVRSRAKEWDIRPDMIGVIGSSAGGHLAATVVTQFSAGKIDSTDPVEAVSSRPDFAILCYPVITMGPQGHGGSKENLLGPNPSAELVDEMSAEKHVRADTPPCFIWHTADDNAVPVENSLMFAKALSEKKVRYELHIYESGPHGLGLGIKSYARGSQWPHAWVGEALAWMNRMTGIQP